MTLTNLLLLFVGVSECFLVYQLRSVTREMRGIRSDLPKMAAAVSAVSLLAALAQMKGGHLTDKE